MDTIDGSIVGLIRNAPEPKLNQNVYIELTPREVYIDNKKLDLDAPVTNRMFFELLIMLMTDQRENMAEIREKLKQLE